MKVTFMKKDQKGFSLVELMIVVAIIGILASLAVPRFQSFQAKARASEAKTSLSHIYTLQMSYHGDNDAYGTLQNIGFSLNGVNAMADALAASTANKIRFSYAGMSGFPATATAAAMALGTCQGSAYAVSIAETKLITDPGLASTGC